LALAAGNSSSDALPLLQAGSADIMGVEPLRKKWNQIDGWNPIWLSMVVIFIVENSHGSFPIASPILETSHSTTYMEWLWNGFSIFRFCTEQFFYRYNKSQDWNIEPQPKYEGGLKLHFSWDEFFSCLVVNYRVFGPLKLGLVVPAQIPYPESWKELVCCS
jgi:hypothetical protein